MLATMDPALHWLGAGFKEALAMLWMTFWPLVLGFTLSGMVQSFLPRDALRSRLGTTSAATVAESSLLRGVSLSKPADNLKTMAMS
jgi:uncharacterized membrane protein YraQ (UPF0718 family)